MFVFISRGVDMLDEIKFILKAILFCFIITTLALFLIWWNIKMALIYVIFLCIFALIVVFSLPYLQ